MTGLLELLAFAALYLLFIVFSGLFTLWMILGLVRILGITNKRFPESRNDHD